MINKEQKELFVSGLEGTTPWELLLICGTAVTGILFYQSLRRPTSSSQWLLITEGMAFWVPMILCQTVWLYPYGVSYLTGQTAIALWLRRLRTSQSRRRPQLLCPLPKQGEGGQSATVAEELRRLSVTVHRSCLMFLTCTAILAVDFHVFPRRFGKTETTGYGWMDLGAASFVIAAGIVSPRARRSRRLEQQARPEQQAPQLPTLSHVPDWKRHLQRILPVLFVGTLRLLTHKELEYQEHVSEYGVHWNFFFTLALVFPISAVMSGRTPSWVQPTITFIVYQWLLTREGLQIWVEEAPRACPRKLRGRMTASVLCDFVSANREGILGCVSYAALYLASEYITYQFFWRENQSTIITTSNTTQFMVAVRATAKLWLVVAALFVIWQLLLASGVEVSRRTTNAAFGVWVLFVNMLQLAAIHLVVVWNHRDNDDSNSRPPAVLAAVNRHGLLTFVVANLLTGAVNLAINTLSVSDGAALGILVVYLSVVGLFAVLVDGAWTYLPSRGVRRLRQESQKAAEQIKKD